MDPDEITSTSDVEGTDAILESANTASETKPITGNSAASKKNAKPAIKSLMLYDSSFDLGSIEAVKKARYPSAKLVSISTWTNLQTEIAKYSSIESLIFYTHSIPGSLLINSRNKTPSDAYKLLAATNAKVTGTLYFEGCSIMLAPDEVIKMSKGLTAPTAVGYTFFSVRQKETVDVPENSDESAMQAILDNRIDFRMAGTPTAQSMINNPGTYRLFYEWFREDFNSDPLPNISPGDFPPRGIYSYSHLSRRSINSPQELQNAINDYKAPVMSGELVTIKVSNFP